ncbi:MAG: hypothetical protein OET41_14125, partial [Xanthomonadales bacterium]|nr:hypothetical protein [Xanthomonadales bacterium]MDH4003067.1 hypothetical protein [Xanthomonadales bacterium]
CDDLPACLRARDPVGLIDKGSNGREPGNPGAANGTKCQVMICKSLYCSLCQTTKIIKEKNQSIKREEMEYEHASE